MFPRIFVFVLKALLIFLIISNKIDAKCERKSSFEVKTFYIDLDMPAELRYDHFLPSFRNDFIKLADSYINIIGSKLISLLEFFAGNLNKHFPYPFNEELKGVAKALNVSIGKVALMNLFYDITAFCTSIVAQEENGHIIHGRNLDYYYPEILQNLTYIAKFKRNGSLLFTSVNFAGFIGIATAHKYKAFTFSFNERDEGHWWLNLLAGIFDKKAQPVSFLTRHLMENITNYNDAVNFLKITNLIAPVYFIIGGLKPYEGVVITRDQEKSIDVWNLNASSSGFEKWFLLETNYDHWVSPPAKDDRRTPGINAMIKTTQAKINYETLMDVLSSFPVCNNETAYSVVMSAREEDTDGLKLIVH